MDSTKILDVAPSDAKEPRPYTFKIVEIYQEVDSESSEFLRVADRAKSCTPSHAG